MRHRLGGVPAIAASRLVSSIGQALMLIVLARGAGPEDFTGVVVITGVGMFLGTLLDFGTSAVLIVERARDRVSQSVAELVSWALQVVPISIVATVSIVAPLDLSVGMVISLAIGTWLAIDFLCEKLFGILIADARQASVSVLIITRRVLPLAIQVALLALGTTAVNAYSAGLVVGTAATAAVSWGVAVEAPLRRMLTLRRPPSVRTLRHAWWYFLAGLSSQGRELEVAALHVVGTGSAGYALAYRVFKPLSILGSTMAQVTLAGVARDGRRAGQRSTILVLSGLAVSGAALAVALAPALAWGLAKLAGPEYSGLNTLAAALLIAALAAAVSAPLGSMLQAGGQQVAVALNGVFFSVVATAGCVGVGATAGAAGAAIWVAGSYACKLVSLIVMISLARTDGRVVASRREHSQYGAD